VYVEFSTVRFSRFSAAIERRGFCQLAAAEMPN